jgi:hypothetical protein
VHRALLSCGVEAVAQQVTNTMKVHKSF